MANLALQKVTPTGVAVVLQAAAAGGDTFPWTRGAYLEVNNASGAAITVTIDSRKLCDQGFDHNFAISVPAGQSRRIGPFDGDRFADSQGLVNVSYSAVTSLTVGAVEVPA